MPEPQTPFPASPLANSEAATFSDTLARKLSDPESLPLLLLLAPLPVAAAAGRSLPRRCLRAAALVARGAGETGTATDRALVRRCWRVGAVASAAAIAAPIETAASGPAVDSRAGSREAAGARPCDSAAGERAQWGCKSRFG